LARGSQVPARNACAHSNLHEELRKATDGGQVQRCDELLWHRAGVLTPDKCGKVPLHLAAQADEAADYWYMKGEASSTLTKDIYDPKAEPLDQVNFHGNLSHHSNRNYLYELIRKSMDIWIWWYLEIGIFHESFKLCKYFFDFSSNVRRFPSILS